MSHGEPTDQQIDDLAQQTKIAIVVAPHLPSGQVANRCAVLATGLAARHPEIIGPDHMTADGTTLAGFTRVPIVVLAASDEDEMRSLAAKARSLECTSLFYLARSQGLRSYAAYALSISETRDVDLDVDAFACFGPKKTINKLTGNLPTVR